LEFQESTELQSLKEIVRFAPSVYEDRETRNYEDFIRIVCNALKNAVNKICEDITKRHQDHGETHRFVHYTSLSTLVSMLKKSAADSNDYLRMYDSAHFNDPDEGQYLVRISEGKLECIGTNTNSHKHAYITSFVPATGRDGRNMRDNVALWMAYGDDCRGCSIEIEFPPQQLSNVLYGEKQAEKTVPLMVSILGKGLPIIMDAISPLMKVGDEPNIQKTKERIARIIWGEIETVCYLYKSEAYDHEQEWRFVMTEGKIQNETNSEIKFEYNGDVKGREVARHYYEHEALSTRKILVTGTTITLGPAAGDPYSLKLYLEDLLKKANLPGPTVRLSKTPYRGR
jgi:hypothetical protein